MRYIALILFVGLTALTSCGEKGNGNSKKRTFKDLPFASATTAKQYSDLILQSIRTNRDKPIFQEFSEGSVDSYQLKKFVGMFSTGMTGRDDWQEIDLFEVNDKKDQTKGFDYAWLDPTDRLGMQIYILPKQTESGKFELEKLEFRSRIKYLDSYGFPHGEIDDYKKLNFNW